MRPGILSAQISVESPIYVAELGTNIKGLTARSGEKRVSVEGSSNATHYEHQETIAQP